MQAVEKGLFGYGTANVSFAFQCIGKFKVRREADVAVEWIEVVDGLEFDELAVVCFAILQCVSHAAHRNHFGDAAVFCEERVFFRRGFAVDEADRNVTAQKYAALFGETGEEGLAERANTRDGGDAQHQRSEEDAETRKAAAHFAPGEFQREGQAVQVRSSATMRPSLRRTMRPQRRASASSCVTRNNVVCARACSAKIRSATSAPVPPSRLPVGSSAKSTFGCGAIARASATRCCSPPESCPG